MRVVSILSNTPLQSEYLPKGQTIASTRSAWLFNCNCPGAGVDSATFSRILQWRWCLRWFFSARCMKVHDCGPLAIQSYWSNHTPDMGLRRGYECGASSQEKAFLWISMSQIKSKSRQRFDLRLTQIPYVFINRGLPHFSWCTQNISRVIWSSFLPQFNLI